MKFTLAALAAALFVVSFGPVASAQTTPQYANPPLYFEQNEGQAPSEYSYIFHRQGLELGFLRNGVDFLVPTSTQTGQIVHMLLVHGKAGPKGQNLLQGQTNYLRGGDPSLSIKGISNFATVQYPDVYPGVSVSFYSNGSDLEHDFLLEAGADPSQIAFRFEGAERVNLTKTGDLQVHAGKETLILRKPQAYQQGSGRPPVDVSYELGKDGTVRFQVGQYDATHPLVIDPVFTFSTYLAGTGGTSSMRSLRTRMATYT